MVHSLCDILCLVYARFLSASSSGSGAGAGAAGGGGGGGALHETLLRLDRKLRALVLAKMSADLSAVAGPLLKLELTSMLNHAFIDEKASSHLARKYWQLDETKGMHSFEEEDEDDK